MPLAVVAVVIGNALGLDSWGFTGLALVAGLLVTLLDREGSTALPAGATRRRRRPGAAAVAGLPSGGSRRRRSPAAAEPP